jgi:hypothetical protein
LLEVSAAKVLTLYVRRVTDVEVPVKSKARISKVQSNSLQNDPCSERYSTNRQKKAGS